MFNSWLSTSNSDLIKWYAFMLQLLYAPTPYIIGIPASFGQTRRTCLPNDVWLFDLDSDTVTSPPGPAGQLPPLPEPEGSMLRTHFKQVCLHILYYHHVYLVFWKSNTGWGKFINRKPCHCVPFHQGCKLSACPMQPVVCLTCMYFNL